MVDFKPKTANDLVSALKELNEKRQPIQVVGRKTKLEMANGCSVSDMLETSALSGVNFYEPSELAISVQAGTPLSVVEAELEKCGQRLAFEPPKLSKLLTGNNNADPSIGGLVATNLSGPARVSRGALRDHLLGVEFVNGKGEAVKSGGRVMKNVTGYDLCKVLAGSWGTLGVLTNVVLKTLPKMETETTLLIACNNLAEAGGVMRQAMQTPFDVISAAYLPTTCGMRHVAAIRIEGLIPSVVYRVAELESELGGNEKSQISDQASIDFWEGVGEVSDHLTVTDKVWKVSVAPTEGPKILERLLEVGGRSGFLDWSGGLIWLGADADDQTVLSDLERWLQDALGGHATLVKGRADTLRSQLPEKQKNLMQLVKSAFDPNGILSPGRFV
ncbi:MAG: FAD-binding protein [Alphaproteobacteria bacterium]